MSDWNPEKYLMFKKQRTRPATDLAKSLSGYRFASIVDIGCGPGNSTAVLKNIFKDARILGIDSSENMIKKARADHGDINFEVCKAEELDGNYDLLFSNACLQWIPDHDKLLPMLMEKLNENGVLAVQMPMNRQEPLFRIISEVASESEWNFENVSLEKNDVLTPEEYFDILSGCSSRFDIWETVYYHPMPTHGHMLDWVRSTRLRPYLDALNDEEKVLFENKILKRTKEAYPVTDSGEVILKFRRFFFTANK